MKHLTIAFVAIGVIGAAARPAHAATIQAANCSRTSVGNAVTAAADGDTVLIPAGTCSWTSQLDVTKGISLLGTGIDRTIIQDNVSKNGSNTSSAISFSVAAPRSFRLSGLTLQGVATDPSIYNKGHIRLDGTVKTFRVDHIKVTNQQTSAILIYGDLLGVIDHSIFSGSFKYGIKILHNQWGGGSNDYGDGSWAEPLYWGTNKAIYIEDCDFTELDPNLSSSALDGLDGARVVFRHNTLHNQNGTEHGADSGGRERGFRSLELYNNAYLFTRTVAFAQWIRGGTGVVFNNTYTGPAPNHFVELSNCRDSDAGCSAGQSYAPWGACNGSGPYDQNTPGQSGYRCVDQPGSGTSRLIAGRTPSGGWINNASDPVYIWNNTVNGSSNNSVAGTSHVQSGRDYFTGTARPGYTPYTYPHPLTAGSSPTPTAPAAPANVRIVS
jgi:hypothetical protein